MPMTRGVRVVVLGAVQRAEDGRYLVVKGYDRVKDESFYRFIGGGVEFMEYAADALKREFKEEIDADIVVGERLGFLENLFTFNGKNGHEYVIIYDVEFKDKTFYTKKSVIGNENGEEVFVCEWIDVSSADNPLYPSGTKELITGRKKTE